MNSLNNMVSEYGSPWAFYRAVYKANGCGPTIGMLFDGEKDFLYCDDLPREEDNRDILKISVSSIVEGSDVEISAHVVETANEFWTTLEEVNEEVAFYWNRDNSIYLILAAEGKEEPIYCVLDAEEGSYWSSNDNDILAEAIIERFLDNRETIEIDGTTYAIEQEYPDFDY